MSSPSSIRRRLLLRVGTTLAVVVLAVAFGFTRYAATAAERAYDQLLSAAAFSILGSVRLEDGDLTADIPPSAFAILIGARDDRVFYRLVDEGRRTVTGYPDLPLPRHGDALPSSDEGDATFYGTVYRAYSVRAVASKRLLTSGATARWVTAIVAQTTVARDALAAEIAGRTLLALFAVTGIAGLLIVLGVSDTLRPVVALKARIEARDPTDFRPIADPVPEEVEPLREALNDLLVRFSASLDGTRSFLADAAHQLRTPLASLLGQTALALRDAGTGPDAERLSRIDRNARLAARIADQLLTDASVTNRLDLAPRMSVDLARLAADVVNDFSAVTDDRSVRLFVNDEEGRPVVSGDAGSLAEALRNLVDNALKYAPPGPPVDVTVERRDGSALVRVVDRGPGIPDADRARVRRRFERGAGTLAVVGSGLGLAIVTRVAAAHDGRFELRNRPDDPGRTTGRGLLAEMVLPLDPSLRE